MAAKKKAAKKVKAARRPAPKKIGKAKKPAKVARKPAPKTKAPAKKPAAKKAPAKKPALRKASAAKKLTDADPTPPPYPTPSSAPTPPPLPVRSAAAPPMHTAVDHPELDEDVSDERDEVFEIFRTYDRDASGSIDRSEFARLLEALGMEVGEEELAIALDVVDANHSGRISWDEFKAWWSSR